MQSEFAFEVKLGTRTVQSGVISSSRSVGMKFYAFFTAWKIKVSIPKKPMGNYQQTPGLYDPLVSIPATPSFPMVFTPWKALTRKPPRFPTGNPWKPLETWGSCGKPRWNQWKPGVSQQETPWKPMETWVFPTGNPVETNGNLGFPHRKPRGNQWKPGVAKQETPWKPMEPGVARQETNENLSSHLFLHPSSCKDVKQNLHKRYTT